MTEQDRKKLKNDTLSQLEKEKFINLSESSRKIIERALDILLNNLNNTPTGEKK